MPAPALTADLHEDLRTLLDLARQTESRPQAGDLVAGAALHLTMLDRETLTALGREPDAAASLPPAVPSDPLLRQFVGHRSALIEVVERLTDEDLARPARLLGKTVSDALATAGRRSVRIRAELLQALGGPLSAAA